MDFFLYLCREICANKQSNIYNNEKRITFITDYEQFAGRLSFGSEV